MYYIGTNLPMWYIRFLEIVNALLKILNNCTYKVQGGKFIIG